MLALALWLAVAEPAAPAKPELRIPAKGSVVFARQPTAAGAGGSFELSVGDCVRPKGAAKDVPADCAVVVTLRGKAGTGKHRLAWTTKPGAIVKQDERSYALGDDADTAMAVSFQAVEIKKGVVGIAVTQQTGSDRIKRRHDVLLARKGRLVHAFTATEPRGPSTFSTLSSVDIDADGFGELVLIQAQTPDELEADRWNVDVYGWRADVERIVALPSLRPTIKGALVGMFSTVADAREMQKNKCLREFLVVDHNSAGLLQDGVFAVVYLSATTRDADLALEAAKACDEGLVGAVKPMSLGLDVTGD